MTGHPVIRYRWCDASRREAESPLLRRSRLSSHNGTILMFYSSYTVQQQVTLYFLFVSNDVSETTKCNVFCLEDFSMVENLT